MLLVLSLKGCPEILPAADLDLILCKAGFLRMNIFWSFLRHSFVHEFFVNIKAQSLGSNTLRKGN